MSEKAVKIGKWKINRDVLLGAGAVATIAIAAATFANMKKGGASASSQDPFASDLGGGSGSTDELVNALNRLMAQGSLGAQPPASTSPDYDPWLGGGGAPPA